MGMPFRQRDMGEAIPVTAASRPDITSDDWLASFDHPSELSGSHARADQPSVLRRGADVIAFPFLAAYHVGQDGVGAFQAARRGVQKTKDFYDGLSLLPRTAIKATVAWYKSPFTLFKKSPYLIGSALALHYPTQGVSTQVGVEAAATYLNAYAHSLKVVPPVGRFALAQLEKIGESYEEVSTAYATVPERAGADAEVAESAVDTAKAVRHPVRHKALTEAERRVEEERAHAERIRAQETAQLKGKISGLEEQNAAQAQIIQQQSGQIQAAQKQLVIVQRRQWEDDRREDAQRAGLTLSQKAQLYWISNKPREYQSLRCSFVVANAHAKRIAFGPEACYLLGSVDL